MNRRSTTIVLLILASGAMASGADLTHQATLPTPNVLTLQQAIRMALDHAPELALARAQTARAGEAVRETRALNLPQIVTGTGLAYNNGFPLSIEGAAPSIIQLALNQAVLSKKNKNLILEAEESQRASKVGSDAVRIELAARTAMLYQDLHLARKLETLWSGRLEATLKEQQVAETLLEAGRLRPVDVTLAKTATANAQQQLLVAREKARLAETALRETTGLPGTTPIQTVESHLAIQALELPVETLYQRAVESHPGIQQAEATVRVKEFHLEAEKGEYYPRLEVVSQYAVFSRVNNYQDYFNRFSRNNYLVGLSIQVPLFNGYRTSARVAQSRQEVAEARFQLQRMKSALRLEIEQSASQLRVARGAADLARLEVAAALENLRINETLFGSGRIGTKELENARMQLQDKEIAAVEAEKALWQRQVELLRVTSSISELF